MRGMEQRDVLTLERQRDLELLGDRVVGGRFRDRPKVLAERAERRSIGRPAEQHELGVMIQPRQLPQQVANIGPDSEIVQLAGVDADAHAPYDTC